MFNILYRLKNFFIILVLIITSISISDVVLSDNYLNNVIDSNDLKVDFFDSEIEDLLNRVNQSKLYSHIKFLEDLGPHPTGSIQIEKAAQYLYNELLNLSYSVKFHNWSYKDRNDKNIIATLLGENKPESLVIICAHYDTVSISPGSEDDSSGVATILMIAEILQGFSFNNTIKFVLFSGEEQGLFGSHEYAEKLFNEGKNIVAVLALDKIGYAQNIDEGHKIKHHTNTNSKWMVKISQLIANVYQNQIDLNVILSSPDPGSDHKSFTDLGFVGSDFVRYGINPFYHTSEDILEHMNMTYLTKACKLTLGTLVKIADLNQKIFEGDLIISILGSRLADPAQLSIGITNNAYPLDTANLTIHVEMKNVFRNKFVEAIKTDYNIPCNWTMEKEIEDFWQFQIGGRRYTRGLFKIRVTIEGFNDDIHIYKNLQTFGLILSQYKVWLISKEQ